jgi:hypothetical protein
VHLSSLYRDRNWLGVVSRAEKGHQPPFVICLGFGKGNFPLSGSNRSLISSSLWPLLNRSSMKSFNSLLTSFRLFFSILESLLSTANSLRPHFKPFLRHRSQCVLGSRNLHFCQQLANEWHLLLFITANVTLSSPFPTYPTQLSFIILGTILEIFPSR